MVHTKALIFVYLSSGLLQISISYKKRSLMRIIIPIIVCILFFSCQKEVSSDTNQTTASTFDSLVGRWRYIHEYRLVTTQADTTVVIDSVYSDHYDPYSYLEIKPDSTYKLWRSASRTLPMYGWGDGGHITIDNSLRFIRMRGEFETRDDFATSTPYPTIGWLGPQYRIKYLGSDSMVLIFKSLQSPGQYWWWHDVYVK